MNNENQVLNTQTSGNKPMKWYNFLIYFGLFISAASYAWDAADSFRFGGIVNIIFGAVYAVTAVLALVARFRLAGYRKNGPTLYLTYYAVAAAANILAAMISNALVGESVFTLAVIIGTGLNVLFFYLQWVYFNKRKHMFVN